MKHRDFACFALFSRTVVRRRRSTPLKFSVVSTGPLVPDSRAGHPPFAANFGALEIIINSSQLRNVELLACYRKTKRRSGRLPRLG